MSRTWLVGCLLLWVGCSNSPVPSGFLDREGEPVLLFRCEGGGIAGYITIDAPERGEDGVIPDGAVPVQFDSPPPCETD